MITPAQAEAAAHSKGAALRAGSREQRELLRPAQRGSDTSGSPTARELPHDMVSHNPTGHRRRTVKDKPTYLDKEWKQSVEANYRLRRPGQQPLRAYRRVNTGDTSQSEEVLFHQPGTQRRAVYMDEVDVVHDQPQRSYFTHHREVHHSGTEARSKSLTTKSANIQRPTWTPKARTTTPRKEPPTLDPDSDIIEV